MLVTLVVDKLNILNLALYDTAFSNYNFKENRQF